MRVAEHDLLWVVAVLCRGEGVADRDVVAAQAFQTRVKFESVHAWGGAVLFEDGDKVSGAGRWLEWAPSMEGDEPTMVLCRAWWREKYWPRCSFSAAVGMSVTQVSVHLCPAPPREPRAPLFVPGVPLAEGALLVYPFLRGDNSREPVLGGFGGSSSGRGFVGGAVVGCLLCRRVRVMGCTHRIQ